MGDDDILQIDASVQQLRGLEAEVRIRATAVVAVVGLGEEPRGAKDDDRELVVAMYELAQVLGGDLRRAVDVARLGDDVLGNPGRRFAGTWGEGPTERAGRAGADEP